MNAIVRTEAGRWAGTRIATLLVIVGSKLRYIKDPETGRRVSRLSQREQWVITDVPEMRIVDNALWGAVKRRQGEIDATPRVQAIRETRFWEKKRATHLLTGLLRCGGCGVGFAAVRRWPLCWT